MNSLKCVIFYITGKIEKETIKFYIIYIIYCCYISETPFHCSRKQKKTFLMLSVTV